MMEKCSSKEKKFIFKYFKERFGVEKEVFKGHELFMSSRKMVFVGPKSIIKNPRVVCPGVSIFRFDNVKPTTNFFQTFGNHVNKSIISLNKENVLKFIAGEDLQMENKEVSDGYVCVKYENFSIGCAIFKNNYLKNMIPKSRRIKLEYI